MSHFIWFLVTFDVVSASKRKSCSIVTWHILHVTSIVEKAVHTPLVDHKDFVVHNEPVLQIFSVVTYRAVRIYTQYFTWKMFFLLEQASQYCWRGLKWKFLWKSYSKNRKKVKRTTHVIQNFQKCDESFIFRRLVLMCRWERDLTAPYALTGSWW